MESNDKKGMIVTTLREKAVLKQKVYDNTLDQFDRTRKILAAMAREINSDLMDADKRVRMDFKERGKFDVLLKVAGDILVFSMHSNVFEFDRNHPVWKIPYVNKNPKNSYCGVINIYNFLADSFKYNRLEDLGYLIARVFINHENQYFVEGKRQMGMIFSNFGGEELSRDALKKILYTAIQYSLEFDLLAPPYDNVKIASVGQVEAKIQYSRMATGKRLGFQFNSDDVMPE
ncbi:MAG: hypothetical protein LC649_03650 [Bacteroidales bacterium]|nr:hypothetical protein [Bacteroidales bacterium]